MCDICSDKIAEMTHITEIIPDDLPDWAVDALASGQLFRECSKLVEELSEKYNDLIYQVATKYPGESRHDTAKRYIKERETPNPDQCGAADPVPERQQTDV